MNAQPPGRVILTKPRARKQAAKALGLALQARLRRLYDAQQGNDENEIVVATADMAQCMYENIEFVIWALKVQGGMNPPPPEELKKISAPQQPANDDPRFRKPPEIALAPELPDDCTCPPLEAGILLRDRHMTSCPKFVP